MSTGWPCAKVGVMSRFLESFDRFADRFLPPGLSDAGLLRIRSLAVLLQPLREQTAQLDQSGPAFVFIAQGAAKLVAHTTAGREQVVGFHFAGDLVTVPATGAHHYCLQALADCELIAFPHAAFREIAASHPGILSRLLDTCEASLARSRDKAVTLGRKTAPERVADFLLTMARRIGTAKDGAIVMELPMSRRDIAHSIGLTIETVSRQFSLLRDEGVIETTGRARVCLLDRAGLEARSGRLARAADIHRRNLRWINVDRIAPV